MGGSDHAADDERAEEHYGYFVTGLLGLLDDAELANYSAEGVEHLRRAREAFMQEFRQRHPKAWSARRMDR